MSDADAAFSLLYPMVCPRCRHVWLAHEPQQVGDAVVVPAAGLVLAVRPCPSCGDVELPPQAVKVAGNRARSIECRKCGGPVYFDEAGAFHGCRCLEFEPENLGALP